MSCSLSSSRPGVSTSLGSRRTRMGRG
jgi:hypothetical protein